MNERQEHRAYEFDDFLVDAQRRMLIARSTGQPVPVTGKIFDTLLYLVEHAGEALDKRTLMQALWPDVIVEEANLTQTIHTLRRVLGERPGEHRFIVTLPGRGYRFVAPVTLREAPAVTQWAEPERPSARRRHILIMMAAAACLAVIALAWLLLRPPSTQPLRSAAPIPTSPSLAVLPFVDMSDEQNQSYFAEGLSEEILNLLAQSSSMRIIARTSSFSFRDRHDLDIESIARKLNATHVLEGSVRKSGQRIRVTAQLVDGATSGHLWSQTFDRDLTDIFRVQDEIAAAVTDSLHAKLNGKNEAQPTDTTSSLAFEHYLNGRYFFNRRGESDVQRARSYFQKALDLDPTYARAWSGLAGTYHVELESGPPDAQGQQAWLQAIERSLSLGPGIAEVHVRAAQYYWWLGDWRTSDQHCKLAIALNPSDALVLSVLASKAISMGHIDAAVGYQRRAVAVDPLSAAGRANLGVYLAVAGVLDEAEQEMRHARELSPMLPTIDAELARVLILERRFDEGLALAKQLPAGPMREQGLALANHGAGNERAAAAALAELIALATAPGASTVLKIRVAEVHAYRGDRDQALQWLERAIDPEGTALTHSTLWVRFEILSSPFLSSLRDHARWRSLVANAT